MRRVRVILWLGLLAILLAGYFVLRSFGILAPHAQLRAMPVPEGDQEVAFIQGATQGATWERFVAGIQRVKQTWPDLVIEDDNAFPEQSAAVPEVSLSYPGCQGKLWFRWYKLTSDASSEQWVRELSRRNPAPLALIGGGSSDRARDLAQALAAQTTWHGSRPLLMISTATADSVHLREFDPVPQPLMAIYPGRSYRFCFTNSQMAEAIWDFVWTQDDLRPFTKPNPLLPAGITQAAAGDLWGSLGPLLLGTTLPQPYMVHIVEWLDDPYSRDLARQFRQVFSNPENPPMPINSFSVPYSVGGFAKPNPREAMVVQALIGFMPPSPDERFLLILPAVDRPARRFLRSLALSAPREIGNVVVVTGDSIAFNTLYRDRKTVWNIQDLPVPIVVFCHQDPVAWDGAGAAGVMDAETARSFTSGTDEELLNADIVTTLVESAFGLDKPLSATPAAAIVGNADDLNAEIRRRRSDYFAADGNRQGGSGEYLVTLRPVIFAGRVLPLATLEVWTRRRAAPDQRFWDRVKKIELDYQESREGRHGGL
jgi:hypothetical protein